MLASKIIEKGATQSKDKPQSNLLITDKDMSQYAKQKKNEVDAHIHERLYQEKDKYFERKNFVSTHKQEEELKLCTFQPNKDRRNNLSTTSRDIKSQRDESEKSSQTHLKLQLNRSFDRFY